MIELADARDWLTTCNPGSADLILTDPPHLDTYGDKTFGVDAEQQLEFTQEWLPLALDTLTEDGTIVHSCGQDPAEIRNYITVAAPAQIIVWLYDAGHHFFLVHHKQPTALSLTSAVIYAEKPDPLWKTLLIAFSGEGDRVFDPFVGRGEIAFAAQEIGREFYGCDINRESVDACWRAGL